MAFIKSQDWVVKERNFEYFKNETQNRHSKEEYLDWTSGVIGKCVKLNSNMISQVFVPSLS